MSHNKNFNETAVEDSTESTASESKNNVENSNTFTQAENVRASEAQNETSADFDVRKAAETQKIAELEKKLAELNEQYLRKAADFENFRKRVVKEKQEAIEFANQSLLLDLIATLDDFERAINSAESPANAEADFNTFRDGVSMIEKRLLNQLENKWGLKRFDSAGTLFDPTRHEALFMEKSADVSEPTVKEDLAKGYTLKDRVVRTAKVKVLMPEKESENGN
ncbi:MAG: nucleotide exchange factor GrpE [Spirochaetaceae bacterium]|jgi:molecular chaperone GrpE|nr:nucleotide exchange factor GrpE [Spirochaetaceae bacterium]